MKRPNSHFSSPTSCFVCRAGSPQPAPLGRGGGGHSYPEHPHVCVCGTGLLPETRSTPFCNHTLHFGGLTMKNTKRIRIIGGDGGNGTAERRTHAISNGGGWAHAHIHAHPRTHCWNGPLHGCKEPTVTSQNHRSGPPEPDRPRHHRCRRCAGKASGMH